MKFTKCLNLTELEKQEILKLWNAEYPEKLSYHTKEAFDEYLKKLTEQSHILLIDVDKRIMGWYFDFKRDSEKWFAIILNSNIQGKGFGTKMLELAKQKENELNGWVIDHSSDKKKSGDFYVSPLGFYLNNGFEVLKEERLASDKISAVKIRWKKTNKSKF